MEILMKSLKKVKERKPYVHHMTNGVTMTDCANMTLAAGGSPAMAHAKEEVVEMVSQMHALVLNTGTITEERCESMLLAGKKANELNIPIVLDPVAVGATSFRKRMNTTLLEALKFSIIRGNASEIMTLAGVSSGRGVDVAGDLTFDETAVMKLACQKQTVIVASGAIDFVTDGKQKAYVHNGVRMLSEVTGTGCMSASLMGVAVGAGNTPFEAALLAVVMMGISGEQAYKVVNGQRQLGTFKTALFDAMSMLTAEVLKQEAKVAYDI